MTPARKMRIFLRLAFLVAAAGGLVVACRQGTSLFTVGVAFAVYVAAATLWIRGQHQASVDAVLQGDERLRPWTFPYRYSAPAAVAGLLAAGVGALTDFSTLLLLGVLLFYLGSGYLLMRFRMYAEGGERTRIIAGAAVLGGSVLVAFVSLVALEHVKAAMWFLALAVLAAPVGLSILAEPAIRWVQAHGRGQVVGRAAAAGAVALLLDAAVAAARVDAWILLGFGALTFLVVAIVSSTQADVAAVIAVVTLMGVTPMSEKKPDALDPQPGQSKVLVALGDSYMSGEGADVFYEEKVDQGGRKGKNHCNRAPTAWAARAGQTRRLFESVAFLACSGARTYNVRHETGPREKDAPPPTQYNEPGTQLDQVDALHERFGGTLDPSLVVVSLGGNDAGFSMIGVMCLAPGNCSDERETWKRSLPTVGKALRETFVEIRDEFEHAPVLVVPYPAPIYKRAGKPVTCGRVALSAKDMGFVDEFVRDLNATVHQAATAERFYFLGKMEDALADAHLQLCDPDNGDRPGINFVGLRSVGGIAEQRFNPANWYHNSLHPNERGHAAMLQVFEQWRADNPDPANEDPSTPASAGGDEPGGANGKEIEPLCDLFYDARSTRKQCREAGAEWTKGQVSHTILWRWWGVQILAAVAAAWLLGVALFGSWKPWWGERPQGEDEGSA